MSTSVNDVSSEFYDAQHSVGGVRDVDDGENYAYDDLED